MNQLELLIQRYPVLESCVADIQAAFEFLKASYEKQGKLLVCGNGGSAADAEHIVGELMKGFKNPRKLSETAAVALHNRLMTLVKWGMYYWAYQPQVIARMYFMQQLRPRLRG